MVSSNPQSPRPGKMHTMDPELQATVVGGVIAAGAGVVAWALGAISSGRQARQQRDHERRERRYDDLKSAYVQFSAEMRKIIVPAEVFAFDNAGTYGEQEPGPGPIDHLQAGAERALTELRLFADEELYQAAREWLEAYYARFWQTEYERAPGVSTDTGAAEERFIAEGKRALGIT